MGKRSCGRIESGMESSVNVRDWSNLPSDLIESILEKVDFNYVDVLRLGAVCKSWHNMTIKGPPKSLPPQLPWLLLSSHDTETETPFRFLNIFDNKIYSLPTASSCSSRYTSSDEWLFILEKDKTCSLVNPETRQQVVLPSKWGSFFLPFWALISISKLPGGWMKSSMRKAVFSSPPNTTIHKDCLVMVITTSNYFPLMFCKVGVTGWKHVLQEHSTVAYELLYEDVIYFKRKFYAVDAYGKIVVCNLTASSPVCEQVREPDPIKAQNTYLVHVSGELVFISRFKQERSGTTAFYLFRQDSFTKVRIETIGDHAIFLGYNHSVSLLASNYSGCKGNSIYFNHSESYNAENAELADCGIFSLANGLIEPLPCYGNSALTRKSPFWVAISSLR